MHGILISPDTLDKITDNQTTYPEDLRHFDSHTFLALAASWYYVSGVLGTDGRMGWAAYPGSVLEREFDYDADKINAEWTTVVKL